MQVMSDIKHKAVRAIPGFGKMKNEQDNLRRDKGILQIEKGDLEAEVRDLKDAADNPRNFLGRHYLRGNGIEIGAAHYPVKMPPKAKVKYVDVFSENDLRKVFPREYADVDLVHIDVVDDGETLSKFKANSLDFIIANHFIEHCLDPIGTILTMYKKLRSGGIIYMAVPDKRYTFDKPRPLTTYAHLLEEHKDKTKQKFRLGHTEEAVRLTEKGLSKKQVIERVAEIMDSGFRIHYHVWTQKEVTEMFTRLAKDFGIDLEIEAILKNRHEVIYLLKKEPPKKLENV